MRVYRRCLAEAPHIVLADVFRRVSLSPASRFWVSEERASTVVLAMLAGRILPPMRQNRREMFQEIFSRFIRLRRDRPDLSFPEAISIVVCQPAPKFYLTPRTVEEFIRRIKARKRKNKIAK